MKKERQTLSLAFERIEELTNQIQTLEKKMAELESKKFKNKKFFNKIRIFFALLCKLIWKGLIIAKNFIKPIIKFLVKKTKLKRDLPILAGIILCIAIISFLWEDKARKIVNNKSEPTTNQQKYSHYNKFESYNNKPSYIGGSVVHSNMNYSNANTPPSISKLIEKSKSNDVENRILAAQSLANVTSPLAAKYIVNLLNDKDDKVQWYAIKALRGFSDYNPGIKKIKEIIRDKSQSLANRREAVTTLGEIGTVKETSFLLSIARFSNDLDLKANALSSLGVIGDANVSFKMVKFLDDKDETIREIAANILGNFNYPNAIDKLIKLLNNDRKIRVRIASVNALSRMKIRISHIAAQLLKSFYQQKNIEVKKQIKITLQIFLPELPSKLRSEVKTLLNQ